MKFRARRIRMWGVSCFVLVGFGSDLQAQSWKADWERAVSAAKKEGRVVVSATAGQLLRSALMAFSQQYPEITLELSGGTPIQFWPRVFQERAVDQFLWDVRITGFGSLEYEARDKGAIAPVRPVLLLPEVTDESKWYGGLEGRFFDREKKYAFGFFAQAHNNAMINRDVISEKELSSAAHLLDPRWQGKIAILEPRSGSGAATLAAFLAAYGEDYVRSLLSKQKPVVTGDPRQLAEWVVRGRYPIGIGLAPRELGVFQKEGVGLNVKPFKEPTAMLTGFGGILLMNRAPHPNAAKVFINWLLTREVQKQLTGILGNYNSARLDVPPVFPQSYPELARSGQYIPTQAEEFLPQLKRVERLAKEALQP